MQDQGVCCETVPPSNVRSNTHRSHQHGCPTWSEKEATNGHAKLDGGEPTRPQLYMENFRGGGLLQGRTYQLDVQDQMVSPENIRTSNIWTQQVISRNLYACTHMHLIIIDEKETMNVKENWEGDRKGLEGGRRKEKCN